jgi:hypothetical protein
MPKYGSANVSVLANQINLGYWQWVDTWSADELPYRRAWENENPGNPTSISVNLSGVGADYQALIITASLTSRGRRFRHHHAAAHADREENHKPTGKLITAPALNGGFDRPTRNKRTVPAEEREGCGHFGHA